MNDIHFSVEPGIFSWSLVLRVETVMVCFVSALSNVCFGLTIHIDSPYSLHSLLSYFLNMENEKMIELDYYLGQF